MVKPASISRYSLSLAGLALLCASQPAFAQSKPAAADAKPESEEAVFIPIEYRPPPYRVAIGLRLAGNAKVKFSGLGSIAKTSDPLENQDINTIGNRTYDTWGPSGESYVKKDDSKNADGTAKAVTDGKTNFWAFTSTDQVVADPNFAAGEAIRYQTNWLTGEGDTLSTESGKSMAWDIEISRELGGNKRFSWGVLFGAGLSTFENERTATVKATLHTIADTYSLGGAKAPRDITGFLYPYIAPGPVLWVQSYDETNKQLKVDSAGKPVFEVFDGNQAYPAGVTPAFEYRDDSVRLADHPFSRDVTSTPGVDVQGTWKVKGSFLTARFGPFVSANLGKRFTVRASAGITFTVIGARMTFEEKFYLPVLQNYLTDVDTTRSYWPDGHINESKVAGNLGYFATGEIEWHMTQRTGLFIGATHEDNLRKTKIQIGDQTAELETSTGTAIRAGVSARF